jgi:DHA1 family inner membrane transport protein
LHPLRNQVLAFTVIRTVLNTMHRMVYPFLLVFGRGLGVDLTVLSLALSGRSLVGVFTPFLASVADSRGRKTGMLFGLVLFTVGVTLVVIWPTFPVFVITLVLTLIGKYVFDPSMQAYLGDRVPYQNPVLALAGVACLLGLAWLLPRDPAVAIDQPGIWRNLRAVLTYPPALAGLGMGLLASAGNEVVNLVFGVWMENSFGLQIAALGAASAVIGLSELGGESLTAIVTDRLGKPRAVGIGLGLNSLAALALPLLGRTLPGAVVGLFFFYLTFEFTLVSSIPMMTEILPTARATLMAANVAGLSLGRSLGALLAIPIYAHGIWMNGLATLAFNLLALLLLRILVGRLAQLDVRRMKSPPA